MDESHKIQLEKLQYERDQLYALAVRVATINCSRAAWYYEPRCGQCTSCTARILVRGKP